jgi:DNA-binding PadR family transcriptional regulator
MVVRGHIVEAARPVTGRRARISYALTPAGQQRFEELLSSAGPSAWEDDAFAVHFAFFGLTDASVRLRILEGRRARLEERLARIRGGGPVLHGASAHDTYTTELYRHGVESAEADLRWITRMIEAERLTHDRAATPRSTQEKE